MPSSPVFVGDRISFFDEIERNNRMTLVLFIVFFLFFGVVGSALGFILGYALTEDVLISALLSGMILLFSFIYAAIAYGWGDDVTLALVNAKPADPQTYRLLHDVVEGIAIAAGIPKPRVYVIESESLNAFAVGRGSEYASVAVTTGLLKRLEKVELEGVIAHEIGHIKNNDTKVMTLAAVLFGGILFLSGLFLRSMTFRGKRSRVTAGVGIAVLLGLLIALLAPFIAQLIRLAISREREYLADATSAQLTRYPYGLAQALEKIKTFGSAVENTNEATAHLFIAPPLKSSLSSLFSTHPPLDERISRLRSM